MNNSISILSLIIISNLSVISDIKQLGVLIPLVSINFTTPAFIE